MKYFISTNDVVHRIRPQAARRHYVSWLGEDEGNMGFNWGDTVWAPHSDKFFIWGEDISEAGLFLRYLKSGKTYNGNWFK